jgi:hypothetical protein
VVAPRPDPHRLEPSLKRTHCKPWTHSASEEQIEHSGKGTEQVDAPPDPALHTRPLAQSTCATQRSPSRPGRSSSWHPASSPKRSPNATALARLGIRMAPSTEDRVYSTTSVFSQRHRAPSSPPSPCRAGDHRAGAPSGHHPRRDTLPGHAPTSRDAHSATMRGSTSVKIRVRPPSRTRTSFQSQRLRFTSTPSMASHENSMAADGFRSLGGSVSGQWSPASPGGLWRTPATMPRLICWARYFRLGH